MTIHRKAIDAAMPTIPIRTNNSGSSCMNSLANRMRPYITAAATAFAATNTRLMTMNGMTRRITKTLD